MLCQSKLLGTQSGVFHGFTTREGGASTGSLSSLNLAWCSGEQKESLWANWDKVAKALAPELSAASVALLHQVHGNRVVEVSSPKGPFEVVADADGAVTTKKGIILAVRVADCVPVLLAAPGGVAVAHAGWRGAAAITLGGLGFAADKVANVNKELGLTITEINTASASAAGLSFIFDDTAGTVKALASEFGTLDAATFGTQLNVGLISSNMGISNTEAATLIGSFARMNGGSTEIAADMIKTTKEYAKQNNVIPSAALSDLAANAEAFALFAKEGGKNMIEAAIGAQQLGTSIGTTARISEGLLDFENSITKELELGAILGKNINFNNHTKKQL